MTQTKPVQTAFPFDLPVINTEVMRMANMQASNQPEFKQETLEFLSIFHETGMVKAVHETIATCHKSAQTNAVESMILIGPSGVGKSQMCTHYRDLYPMYVADDQVIAPVLYLLLPNGATTKDIVTGLLEQLNQKLNIKGSELVLKRRFIGQVKNAQTKLIFLDEAQRLNHSRYQHSPKAVAELLAYIQDLTGIAFVLSGTPDLLDLLITIDEAPSSGYLTANAEQEPTVRRFRNSQSIPAYKINANSWTGLLKKVFERFPRVHDDKGITLLNERIYIATQGRLGFLSKLFKEVLETTEPSKNLNLTDYGVAYKKITSLSLCGFNPFEVDDHCIKDYMKSVLRVAG